MYMSHSLCCAEVAEFCYFVWKQMIEFFAIRFDFPRKGYINERQIDANLFMSFSGLRNRTFLFFIPFSFLFFHTSKSGLILFVP